MKARHISRLLFTGVAISLVYGMASSVRADDDVSADPFTAVESIEKLDLDDLRGADANVVEHYTENTTAIATSSSESTTTTDVTINTSGGAGGGNGGAINGGNVSFSGNALQNFGGVWTSAINTAPGGAATALTSMSIILNP
jgi:hypothetical protein